ncbi:MAG: hypothetical protein KA142_04710, partial [Chromatiaceae bacterium]|nr:hypothetical protein [Chromatiaceae bacterium]
EEEKGHHKEGAMQSHPQIGPGHRVHQGAEEVGGIQKTLREKDLRPPCLIIAGGRRGSNQGGGQGMEAIGE